MDEDIVEKLREENPEQLFILVRMHLSFITDMNTDEYENDSPTEKTKSFRWGFKRSKSTDVSQRGPLGPARSQEPLCLTQQNISQIYQLIDILSEDTNVCQEGIFRRTGSLSRQQLLRKLLLSGASLEAAPSQYSAHDMASVLKGVLSDTPEPLLLNQHYQSYCHLASTYFADGAIIPGSESRAVDALQLLLLLLPGASRRLAARLLTLLHRAAAHEHSNRMSPIALATMFTPHVMCPRRLSPEALHADSQSLAPVLSFMIQRASSMFVTPVNLATDIAAYFTFKEKRRLLSPNGEDPNESVSERTAASTVFTFVDRQRSVAAAEPLAPDRPRGPSATDAALAQLYAHIQSLPDSHNKKRLIKQFNRENGNGTPLQLQRAQKHKSIGESLKKHIFNKNIMNRSSKKHLVMSGSIESPSLFKINTKAVNFKLSNTTAKGIQEDKLSNAGIQDVILDEKLKSDIDKDQNVHTAIIKDIPAETNSNESDNSISDNDCDVEEASFSCDESKPLDRIAKLSPMYTSEPNLSFLPSSHEVTPKFSKNHNSKTFKSRTLLTSHLMAKKDLKRHIIGQLQKNGSVEKSTKEVSDHSLNIYKSCVKCSADSSSETEASAEEIENSENPEVNTVRKSEGDSATRLCRKDSLKYLRNRRLSQSSNSSQRKSLPLRSEEETYEPLRENNRQFTKNEYVDTPKVSALPSKLCYLTSTPAVSSILMNSEKNYEGYSTPIFHAMRRGSMSPITKSTQKMSKAMQESIMTPRSRKPVIINCDPPTSIIPCRVLQDSATVSSESSSSDTIYDSSSMKNDSDFVSTDESCPSTSCHIKYTQINNTRGNNSSRDKSNSSAGNLSSVSDSVLSQRKLRILQERQNACKTADSLLYNSIDQPGYKLLETSHYQSSSDVSEYVGKDVSLTDPFREYLLCRSVLTGSPVDLSFATGPDDSYQSEMDIENLSEGRMTESLLFCMNGNRPSDLTNSDFDNSQKELLLKDNDSISDTSKIIETKEQNNGDSLKGIPLELQTAVIDKENVSPANKRPAHAITIDGTEVKKVNLNKSHCQNTKDDKKKSVSTSLQKQDYWEYKYGPMWETNL